MNLQTKLWDRTSTAAAGIETAEWKIDSTRTFLY